VWLNQGISVTAWRAWERDHHSTFDALKAPFLVLYRRALDEEMYFAVASATLGQPYDRDVFDLRGKTPLAAVDVPADGKLHAPYREVALEYPPPNLPFIILPRVVCSSFGAYARVLGALMGSVLVGAAYLASRAYEDVAQRLFAFGLLLLAHGAIAIQRLDALVALLLVLIVDAALRDDDRMLGFWTGLVGATKILPAAAGVAALLAGGVRDTRRLLRSALGAAVGFVLGFGPQLLLDPGSVRTFLRYHGDRGLHVESSLGVLYGAVKALLGRPEQAVIDYGSFNFHGSVADALAKASAPLLVLLVLFVLFVFRKAARSDEERRAHVVLAVLATTIALWLGGKVFSPQYLTWALPLVVALPGRAWRPCALLFGAVLVVSQVYYRGYYDHIYLQRPLGVATMLLRLVMLGALLRWTLMQLRKTPASAIA
jgi:hypothetical protein